MLTPRVQGKRAHHTQRLLYVDPHVRWCRESAWKRASLPEPEPVNESFIVAHSAGQMGCEIRSFAAHRFECKAESISWELCLKMACRRLNGIPHRFRTDVNALPQLDVCRVA